MLSSGADSPVEKIDKLVIPSTVRLSAMTEKQSAMTKMHTGRIIMTNLAWPLRGDDAWSGY